MASPVVLGIDTSNYRTSLCLLDEQGEVRLDKRQWLTVAQGERGLKQADAVFQHLRQLPELVQEEELDGYDIRAVAVSTKPRPLKGSYMPVFTVGTAFAQWLSSFRSIPLYRTTHQEGHIWAALRQHPQLIDRDLWVLHLSGGTSDVLDVRFVGKRLEIATIGGSRDLHVGQLVDRVGVALGLPFPAGAELERLARTVDSEEGEQPSAAALSLPSSVVGSWFSFSGPEAAAMRLIEEGAAAARVARAVERCIAATLEKVLRHLSRLESGRPILLVGGVAGNRWIRQRLSTRWRKGADRLFFTPPRFSGDNACGIAYWGLQMLADSIEGESNGQENRWQGSGCPDPRRDPR